MSGFIRSSHCAMAFLFLSSWAFTPAIAETMTYKYGFCLGVAGSPPVNKVTSAFVLGTTNGDLRAEFMHVLGEKYGGNLRRDATGCRMFPTASEAEQARRQLLDQAGSMSTPFGEIDWIPKGASPLPTAAQASGAKAIKPQSPAAPDHAQ